MIRARVMALSAIRAPGGGATQLPDVLLPAAGTRATGAEPMLRVDAAFGSRAGYGVTDAVAALRPRRERVRVRVRQGYWGDAGQP